MKFTLNFYLALGIILAFTTLALSAPTEDIVADESVESRTGLQEDRVQPRVHAALIHAGIHHGLHHLPHHHHLLHHGLLHHGLHHAIHHPILTKKLLLLKFKKIGALAHHHHHHGAHHLLHHGLFHHHGLFRSAPTTDDSVVEIIPIGDGSATLTGVNNAYAPTVQVVSDTPSIQAYAVPTDYLQSVSETPDDSDLDNYEEVNLEEVPEVSPINKHLLSAEGLDQAPVYLYAVPQQVELGRSATARINKNRRKFKN